MSNNYKRLLVCSAVSLVLAGCATTSKTEAELGSEATDPIVTNAAAPTVVKPYRKIEDLLACINDTGALHGLTFVIGPLPTAPAR
jgi:uncharacterized lipoprotein YajG